MSVTSKLDWEIENIKKIEIEDVKKAVPGIVKALEEISDALKSLEAKINKAA